MQTTLPQLGCQTATCDVVFPPDVEVYNLQSNAFYNTTALSFVVDCPPGYACVPGEFPKVVTYPPGTFVIPDPVQDGFPILIQLQGCKSNVFRQLPANASQAAIAAAVQAVIAEVAAQQAQCDVITGGNSTSGPFPNPKPTFLNQSLSAHVDCSEGTELTYTGSLPTYLTLDTTNNLVVMAAGQVGGTTQAAANASAQTFLNNWVTTEVTAGRLVCVTCTITTSSPLPDGNVGDAYSETLTVTGLTGTPDWTVVDGTLPDGLSLNSATGEISGTPTTEETDDFTVQVTNGVRICEKAFSLQVTNTPPFDCLGNPQAIQDCVWTQDAFMPAPPCASQSVVGGSGAWAWRRTVGGGCDFTPGFVDITTTLCNPGSSYAITVNIPWDESGSVAVGPPYQISWTLFINGVQVDNTTRDMFTGPFTPAVLTGNIPNGAANVIRLIFSSLPAASPQYDIFSDGNLTITPLTPP